MATATFEREVRLHFRLGNWLGYGGIFAAHVLAFASLFFQVLWIVPVYQSALSSVQKSLPPITNQAIHFASQFTNLATQWSFVGLLGLDLTILACLLRWSGGKQIAFSIYSHAVIVGFMAYLVWNSVALVLGLARL